MNRYQKFFLAVFVAGWLGGCEKQTPPPSEPPVDAPTPAPKAKPAPPAEAPKPTPEPKPSTSGPAGTSMPAGHPGGMPDPHAATGGGTAAGPQPTETRLDGITLQVPAGWVAEVPEGNPQMPSIGAPKAVFRLAAVEGDGENVYVRVTHFPGMNISDELNIDRWYGGFTQPDGRSTKEASAVETFEVGGVQVVLADIPGTMTVAGGNKPGWRMLGVIIKHAQGPHFVKVVGPARSVGHWKDSVVAYLKSVKTN
jgi:hypothetical protein